MWYSTSVKVKMLHYYSQISGSDNVQKLYLNIDIKGGYVDSLFLDHIMKQHKS